MKLAFLIWNIDYKGGGETVTELLSESFSLKGYDVSIVSVVASRKELKSGIKICSFKQNVESLDVEEFECFIYNALKDFSFLIVQEKELFKVLNFKKVLPNVKVISVYHTCPCINWVRVVRPEIYLNRGRFRFLKTCVYPFLRFALVYYYKKKDRIIIDKILSSSDLLVLLCKGAYDIIRPFIGDNFNKCLVLPNPIMHPKELNLKTIHHRMLFVGRVSNDKGVYDLINIWKYISDKYPYYELIIAGDFENEIVRNQVVALKSVQVLGFFENMDSLYSKVDILLHTSFFEGLPMSILESISHGVVPISFDCPTGPSDIIINGYNGFLIPNRDCQTFCSSIDYLLNSELTLLNMKSNAFNSSLMYDINTITNRWVNEVLL